MKRSDGAILPLYRAGTALLTPLAPHLLRRRLRRGKEDEARFPERMGHPGAERPQGFLVWLHGASLGEGLALIPVVERLRTRGAVVLVTTGTVTSARVLAGRLQPGVIHQFVPLDVPRFLQRFLSHWRPDLVLLAESELWPNILVEVARRDIPLALVNARMSARSHSRWRRRAPSLIGAMLDRTTLCLAQSAADAERFADLGARQAAVAGNLKYDAVPPPADAEALAQFTTSVAGRPIWLAASTHRDEEAIILQTHAAASALVPNLLTVIVPRQAERGPALVERATNRNLRVRLRSRGEMPTPDTDLFVADTFGELGLFYRAADLVFVGKSLAGGGGQNPIEPAKLRRAVLHGPLVGNFAEAYHSLGRAGGALEVADGSKLTAAVVDLLVDRGRLDGMAQAAQAEVDRLGGATDRILGAIGHLLAVAP